MAHAVVCPWAGDCVTGGGPSGGRGGIHGGPLSVAVGACRARGCRVALACCFFRRLAPFLLAGLGLSLQLGLTIRWRRVQAAGRVEIVNVTQGAIAAQASRVQVDPPAALRENLS